MGGRYLCDLCGRRGQTVDVCQRAVSEPVLYIRVGPSKTATTFLQRDVAGGIESAECCPVPEIAVEARPLQFGDLFSLSPEFPREREIRLTEALSEEILTVYGEGNRSLDEQLPHLNLDEYGYY